MGDDTPGGYFNWDEFDGEIHATAPRHIPDVFDAFTREIPVVEGFCHRRCENCGKSTWHNVIRLSDPGCVCENCGTVRLREGD